MLSVESIAEEMNRLGHAFFDKGALNLNLIGVRNASHRSEKFDDVFCLIYREMEGSPLTLRTFAMTTEPGRYYLEHPMHVEGTAVLAPQQGRGAYVIGRHKGLYPALVQDKPMSFHRDYDFDEYPEATGRLYFEDIGANIHHANAYKKSTEVGKWSAACQVFADPEEYALYWSFVLASAKRYGNRFTYTLLDDWGVL